MTGFAGWFLSYGVYIAYFLFLIAFVIYSYFALYHLEEYGFVGDACRTVFIIYLILVGVILFFTIAAFFI